ncbi:unnamed protein product [Ectocarpus sp. CCAP 1310/34]|nr:unnamed protein product [Ectocarpus sp. CCAP 1310/34]
MEHCYRPRHHRLELILLCGAILSGVQLGTNAFCPSSFRRRPVRITDANRRTATARSAVCEHSDDTGEPPLFKSVEDLEALTVVKLKQELKVRGLKHSGRKADLVRLLAAEPGVLTPPSPPPSPPSSPPGDVLSDEEVARWMEEDTVLPPPQPKPKGKKRRPTRPVAVTAEEVLGGIPAARTFSSSRLGSAAAAKELIRDAELADVVPARAPPKDQAASRKTRSTEMGQASALSSSSSGKAAATTPRRSNTNNGAKPGDGPATGASTTTPPLLLPEPTEDMRKRAIIMDLLERRETTFELEEGLHPADLPRSGAYVVSTKKALRPWDGPHADRAETHVVVLLTDVFGYGDSFTRNAADEIAEVCDAIVVVPDMFRRRPWTHEQPEEEYEDWRSSHDPDAVANDIRACVDFARKEFKATSLGLVGFCYGGGRALEEAAAGVVKPDNVVVFYPTRYDVSEVASRVTCPVAAFFAEHDVLPGATVEDACALREKLRDNEKASARFPGEALPRGWARLRAPANGEGHGER